MTTKAPEARCDECRFWLAQEGSKDDGVCRRFPPYLVLHAGGLGSFFPIMKAFGWCGEFRAKNLQ